MKHLDTDCIIIKAVVKPIYMSTRIPSGLRVTGEIERERYNYYYLIYNINKSIITIINSWAIKGVWSIRDIWWYILTLS